jgi:hypothetical protein
MRVDLEQVANDDRDVFSIIAQSIFTLIGMEPTDQDSATLLLVSIRKQCEQRVIAIDGALKDD